MLESKYCEANNLQNSNSSTASGNALGKNVKDVFMEKTKTTDIVKTASLGHSTKQGDSNSNINNRVKEIWNNINTNNRGLENKKNLVILGDSIIKHVNEYDNLKYLLKFCQEPRSDV